MACPFIINLFFLFSVQAKLQLHIHNFHIEKFCEEAQGSGARNTACFCVYYWLREATVSDSGGFLWLLVKAFGNGNGIDGTKMELPTAP